MWFEELLGFREENPEQVRGNLILEDDKLSSKINEKTYQCGTLEIPTLKELKASAPSIESFTEKMRIQEVVGDVRELHKDSDNNGAIFQAASQFNLLEMVGPHITPERGVGIYERDRTQGPACAIACGAGTIYRNYFVPIGNQIGQTARLQVDCLEEIGLALQNEEFALWEMRNGYALANSDALDFITKRISELDPEGYEQLKGKLKIGIQWDSQVTISDNLQIVSQAYCSALPVAYSQVGAKKWESFARLILDATYEATFYAALKNYVNTGNNKLYLTLVGGGAFGNQFDWIFDAIEKSVRKFSNTPLDVRIVSYGHSNSGVREFVAKNDSIL